MPHSLSCSQQGTSLKILRAQPVPPGMGMLAQHAVMSPHVTPEEQCYAHD